MSQSYSSNCFSTANVIETDMQNVENNFDALRSLFSGSSAPTSPDPAAYLKYAAQATKPTPEDIEGKTKVQVTFGGQNAH